MSRATPRVVGLVCEGPSDHTVLEPMIRAIWPAVRQVLPLQPTLDHTGHADGASGWTGVRSWCLEHAGRLETVVRSPIGPQLDLLLVVVDADIVDEAESTDSPSPDADHAPSRVCGQVKSWLAASQVRLPAEVVIAVPAAAMESWVIAALYPSQRGPEGIPDPTAFLVHKGELRWDPRRTRKASKPPGTYRRFAAEVVKNMKRVRNRCPEAERAIAKIENVRDRTAR